MNIVFRCDASPVIGSGHLMRCLTLADVFSAKNWQCSFISSAESVETFSAIIKKSGYPFLPADSAPKSTDLLVIDHYGLGLEYEKSAREWSKYILVLDDLADRPHDCDILIDQTYGRAEEDYKSLVPENCRILTGAQYAILRPQFGELRAQAQEKRARQERTLENLLISLGSTNLHNITGKILSAFVEAKNDLSPLQIHVVLGSKAAHIEEVRKTIEALNQAGRHNVTLHQDVENMAELMLEADLAIGAGGTTSWERCTLGLPTILIEIADNQKQTAQALATHGAIINLGWHEDVTLADILKTITELQQTPQALQSLSQKAFEICDGGGTQKILNHLKALISTSPDIRLRPARLEDAQLLLDWRNDPATRQASLNTDIIAYEDHVKWFKGVLEDQNRHLYIATHDNHDVGTIRADLTPETGAYNLSWSVAPEHQGKGVGKKMLSRLMEELEGPFTATIRKDNTASIRIAETTGMMLEKEAQEILYYCKN
ncbi:MAG: UDP-2,4-diacetamido-2,4,6-trideoxy-beta-L-altropyranose hydrolase [Alphaproteobacteria bacterium]|nr:UDP-2,4-diacetamido-2,4,6-trideoxy-beta-L-altropyranose hydrolase [Alphaproteobacteria bacterium]